MTQADLEARIVELETKVAFQEDTIGELNTNIARLQYEADELRQELKALQVQVRAMTPSNIASEAEETPPPHY